MSFEPDRTLPEIELDQHNPWDSTITVAVDFTGYAAYATLVDTKANRAGDNSNDIALTTSLAVVDGVTSIDISLPYAQAATMVTSLNLYEVFVTSGSDIPVKIGTGKVTVHPSYTDPTP